MKQIKELKPILIELDKLVPYENNAKEHPQWQIEQIMKSIQKFGFNDPIAVNEDMGIIEGHGRYLACKELGIKKVPCIILSGMTADEERAYIIAHNKLTMNTGFNGDLLQYELNSLSVTDIDIESTGFTDYEVENIISKTDDIDLDDLLSDDDKKEKEPKRCPHCGELL